MSFAQLKQAALAAKSWSQRYRWPLTLVGALLLAGGISWSIQQLALDPAQIRPEFLALVAAVLVPAGIVVAALNLQLMGRTVGTTIAFRTAIAATAYGRIAEILPIPGAAMVRGAALMHSGANLGQTTAVLVWSSLMTLSMVGICASYTIITMYPAIGWLIAAGSSAGVIVTSWWFLRHTSAANVGAMIALRIANVGLSVLRFWACFAALGIAVPFAKAAVFVVASSVTTYIGIVPGGLGISESLSAGLALIVDMQPSAAFLAAASDRIAGLAISGLVALLITSFTISQARETT